MGLFTSALAFGAGYTLGKPVGREQAMSYLQRARDQARSQASNPRAEQVLDRGRRIVADQLRVVAQRTDAGRGSPASDAPATTSTAPGSGRGGFGGTTVAEDSDAVMLGMDAPSPSPRPGTPGSPPTGS